MKKYRVLIIGGGSGGISTAARLAKSMEPGSIALVEPNEKHYYQPLWTLVGAGVASAEESERNERDLIPHGVEWIRDFVQRITPEKNQVILSDGRIIEYEFLVVASGLRLAWEKIKGLEGKLGRSGICSIYQYEDAKKTNEMIRGFQGGRAIFTMPPVPIKCAGAPQKIMYLADHVFRKNGVRDRSEINFATAGKAMFGIPLFSNALDKVVQKKGIHPLFQHRLVEVRSESKVAVFEVVRENGQPDLVEISFDLLHVVPPMEAHSFIRESGMAFTEGDQRGWLKVDRGTLQHLDYANVFGIGDVTGVPNSKTGAAVRKQVPVVVGNLLEIIRSPEHPAKLPYSYDGYSSCPLVTEVGKVMLAEFGYDGKLMPTFPLNPAVERRSMWILKRYLLPILYWQGMLKGRA